MTATVHSRTPSLSVSDGRGLPIRQVAYLRSVADKDATALTSRQTHDVNGRLVAQWDPRLPVSSISTVYGLAGEALKVASVDAGWRLSLPGLAAEQLQRWDERGGHWRSTFDDQLRVVAVEGRDATDVDTFIYADASADAGLNLRGQLLEQKDPSGALRVDSYALTGQPLSETRTFLDGEAFTSQRVFNPLGAVLEQIDAGDHRQQSNYGQAGQLRQLQLLVNGQTEEQEVLLDAQYNAEGKIVEQLAGNGVRSRWTYDPANGRLRSQSSHKDAKVLQDFEYFYDPAGNIIRIEDHAFAPTWFANQFVDGHRDFSYDSLYRLISASGYDDGPLSDIPGIPQPTDPNNRLNYIQTFTYDAGGNLTELVHVRAGASYTRQMRIDPTSNRGMRWQPGDPEPVFDTLFDRHGNLLAVQPGQPLQWNARDELHSVTLIHREGGQDDAEHYHYSQGQRVFKRHETFSGSGGHFHQVHYLPGLEIRSKDNGEELHVISVGNARCLHWAKKPPADIDNNQLRYSLEDHLGSCTMELDHNAQTISEEGYYAFGTTAWMTARSAIEVSYKFVRYSGKEMDVSGLYYYGARYYAPWLQRWISADPAGDVDGLNLYGFVGNNPLGYFDAQGRQRTPCELLVVTREYEQLLSTVTRRLDRTIYQLNHLNSTKDIYTSSAKRAVLTLFNVLASAITAATVGTLATAIGTVATLNPLAGVGIGIGAAALAADATGAEIDRLGEDNAFGYPLLPNGADYDLNDVYREANPSGFMNQVQSLFQKYDPGTVDGNKETLIVGTIGAADTLTGGTHLEKWLAFFRLSIEMTEAFNDSLGPRDLDLVERGIETLADYLTFRQELANTALKELESLGGENIATAQGTHYRLKPLETSVLGKMNRVVELLPRVASRIQQKNAA
ncbi:RHS repeat-associated core domain-containing protein [Pseudomonas sp. NPDC087598]|uniref:RHS repeat-associated core domain-containing protein n=1 Tax=Pseudomonas sp. NPDC087598 TaxID=3364440 RepID=UPI003826075B